MDQIMDVWARVTARREVAQGIYEMTLCAPSYGEFRGGQFVNLKLEDGRHVLRRPLCICDFDVVRHEITVCYAVVGEGTRRLSELKVGEIVKTMIPLGNGFTPESGMKKIVLLGGGMGCAVLPAAARANADCECYAYLGFADRSKVVLEERMRSLCVETVVTTDDGSYGRKGFVTDALAQDIERIQPDAVFCCGPEVMYRALAKALAPFQVPVYVSLEQRMGCGIGACLVCSCKIKRNGEENYLRVCKDGPVFRLDEVVL